mmetsp:Transcript_58126/g.180581  ORF Transcript_58126/g.180581 Transcript_58126/m.180581 type:complete len:228 (+) Transcript_58126:385-1068(+)
MHPNRRQHHHRHDLRIPEGHGLLRRRVRRQDQGRPQAQWRLQRHRLLAGQQPHPRLHPEVQRPAREHVYLRPRDRSGRRGLPGLLPAGKARRSPLQGAGRGPRRPRLQPPLPACPLPGRLLPRGQPDPLQELLEELPDRPLEQRGPRHRQRYVQGQLCEDEEVRDGEGAQGQHGLPERGGVVGRLRGGQELQGEAALHERDQVLPGGPFRPQDGGRGRQDRLRDYAR